MVKFLDLKKINDAHAPEISAALARVQDSGWYLRGKETTAFEEAYAQYIGTKFAVGCGNGLDALKLIFRALLELGRLEPGAEVIVPANTYIASILALSELGLTPILVEPDPATLQLDPEAAARALTPRTGAILTVHLYGRCAYDERLEKLVRDNNLLLVEDNAQAHGCTFRGRRTGSLGHAAAHSFYPGKNLGALGDAGAVTTDDPELAALVSELGNYGSARKYVFDYLGYNSRLDELHAAVLAAKLPFLDAENLRRREVAARYFEGIDNPLVTMPMKGGADDNVFHIFPVLSPRRDELQAFLRERGVETLIHYPIPPHKQRCYSPWNSLSLPLTERIHREELSLPMSQVMTDAEIQQVIDAVNAFS